MGDDDASDEFDGDEGSAYDGSDVNGKGDGGDDVCDGG